MIVEVHTWCLRSRPLNVRYGSSAGVQCGSPYGGSKRMLILFTTSRQFAAPSRYRLHCLICTKGCYNRCVAAVQA
jgi:hypothetical protein